MKGGGNASTFFLQFQYFQNDKQINIFLQPADIFYEYCRTK